MKQMERRIKSGALFVPIVLGGVALFSLILMLIWNAVLPEVVGVKHISYLQALGIFALSKILFGFNRGWGGRKRGYHPMQEKLANLTPEQREEFKARWGGRCMPRSEENKNTTE